MGKYEPLKRYLEGCNTEEVPLTFAQIERILGSELPPSKGYPAWWSNNSSNNVMTRAWLAAGYRSERVDVTGEKLVFRRHPGRIAELPRSEGGVLDRLRAALAGTVHVPEG